jgi:hypothetical protein
MANEIDTLIRKLGTDGFVGDFIGADAATVLKWRKRNRVPNWWIDKLSDFAVKQGQKHATPEWLTLVSHGVRRTKR